MANLQSAAMSDSITHSLAADGKRAILFTTNTSQAASWDSSPLKELPKFGCEISFFELKPPGKLLMSTLTPLQLYFSPSRRCSASVTEAEGLGVPGKAALEMHPTSCTLITCSDISCLVSCSDAKKPLRLLCELPDQA